MSVSKIMENVETLSTTNSHLLRFLNLSFGTDLLERKEMSQTLRKSTNRIIFFINPTAFIIAEGGY